MTAPQYTLRGLAVLAPLRDDLGRELILYESSATEPRVWLQVKEQLADSAQFGCEAVVHLSLEDLAELRDQCSWLIENHHLASRKGQ